MPKPGPRFGVCHLWVGIPPVRWGQDFSRPESSPRSSARSRPTWLALTSLPPPAESAARKLIGLRAPRVRFSAAKMPPLIAAIHTPSALATVSRTAVSGRTEVHCPSSSFEGQLVYPRTLSARYFGDGQTSCARAGCDFEEQQRGGYVKVPGRRRAATGRCEGTHNEKWDRSEEEPCHPFPGAGAQLLARGAPRGPCHPRGRSG
ncbi:hypothetical protein SAMN04487913_11487 [Arthrobacter sp. ok362]|nr:hypothetical protein SAMN04487913_11487 [Arthrobacter sp. ok362]